MSALPGPWEVSGTGIWAISPLNARVRIAEVTYFSPMNGIDSAANGRLLAAAPELLAALDQILNGSLIDRLNHNDDGLVDFGGTYRPVPDSVMETWKQHARAAINKATGETK